MDIETLMDLVYKYTILLVPLITALIQGFKKAVGEPWGSRLEWLLSIALGVGLSYMLMGAIQNALVVGAVIGSISAGLWEGAKQTIQIFPALKNGGSSEKPQ